MSPDLHGRGNPILYDTLHHLGQSDTLQIYPLMKKEDEDFDDIAEYENKGIHKFSNSDSRGVIPTHCS